MGYCEYAEQENQYQTNDYERRQDHGQTIVVHEYASFWTNECQTPVCARNRLIAHDT